MLPTLETFDGIIGFDFLNEIKAKLNVSKGILFYNGGEEKLLYLYCRDVNSTQDRDTPMDENELSQLLTRNSKVFADANESLPFNTSIVATIRTTDNYPIYSKSYPYPMSASEFVNKEILNLLENGIIRPSRSPYNNPVWVVDKKGNDESGKRKMRLVLDFRKLNSKTVSDKYPIPNTSTILANLGKASFFTTIDLKSGFHQINLCERDREKTAFSINNGKYEFCRLPFGLKNAPSIFQRAIDDVLRKEIGKCCHVYIDDVIIFSETKEQHFRDIETILQLLYKANMRVAPEKSRFFKKEVEFLGFVVSSKGIKTCPDKVKDIVGYETPRTLRSLRSFLGLSGYYRRFIRDYAQITKPLTRYLRGENGNISKNQSKNKKVELDAEALEAFEKVKQILASEDVLLLYPDFNKAFDLTTDASSFAIGAVLSQDGRPITMISRTLSSTEESFATNERELLAIVWSLQKLRHYLYGVNRLNIYTDHQPLTFAISDKNPNTKLKRWRAFVEEFSPVFHYKPGKENFVADALSRQYLNTLQEPGNSNASTVHSEVSFTETIRCVKNPLNCFRNQLIVSKGPEALKTTKIIFKTQLRHSITFNNMENLINLLKEVINPNCVNAIHCDLPTLGQIQDKLISMFPSVKFVHTKKMVNDIFNPNDQAEILSTEHNRAHRSARENECQILTDYYFPNIRKRLKEIVSSCAICKEAKYQRHPPKPKIGKTPVPTYSGEIIHIDIYSTAGSHFLTCVDKFSKFAVIKRIKSRAIIDVKEPILELLNLFKDTKTIVCDNEKAFTSESITSLLRDHFGITMYNTPPFHSVTNGQVERFHNTLSEIARCIKLEKDITDTSELLLLATVKYNRTIHSVTSYRPIDVIHSISPHLQQEIKERISETQRKDLVYHNKKRFTLTYHPGDEVFVRTNKRVGNKFRKLFIKKIVQKDLGTKVLIDGKLVHKENLR